MRRLLVVVLMTFALAGCVSKKALDEAQADSARWSQELGQCQAELDRLKGI